MAMILAVQLHPLSYLRKTSSAVLLLLLAIAVSSELVGCLSVPQNRQILKRGLQFSASTNDHRNVKMQHAVHHQTEDWDHTQKFHLVPGDPIHNSQTNGAKSPSPPVRCNSSDPKPDPQPAPPHMGRLEAKFGCPWTWTCFKDEARFPPTWLEAVLVEPGRAFCKCFPQSDKKGSCRVIYTQSAALRKAHKDEQTGTQLWRIASVPFAAGAYCHIPDKDDQQAK